MVLKTQGTTPLHAEGTQILAVPRLDLHSSSTNNPGGIIGDRSTRLFKYISILRLRRIARHRRMTLQNEHKSAVSKLNNHANRRALTVTNLRPRVISSVGPRKLHL